MENSERESVNNNNSQTNSNSTNKQHEAQRTHEASKDIAHTVGKGAATYFGGAVGNKAYDVLSKTKLGKGIENVAGKAIEKSPLGNNPIGKKAINKISEKGITSKANQAIDTIGGSKNQLLSGFGKQKCLNKGLKSTNKALNNSSESSNPITKKNDNEIQNTGIKDNNESQGDINEPLHQEKLKKENSDKKIKNAKSLIKIVLKNPAAFFTLTVILTIIIFFFFLIFFIVSDIDLVGTDGMIEYSEANPITGYCSDIYLIKEHDEYNKNDIINNIDEVNLEETFTLNKEEVLRWKYTPLPVEDYIKGVVQAEASAVDDETTFEVAAITARTYALQIASQRCFIWDNTNKKDNYKNPQNYISTGIDSRVASAVDKTNGIVISYENQLLDLSEHRYYDYFCHDGKTRDEGTDNYFYETQQENEEEKLLVPVDWVNDNIPTNLMNISGKFNGGIWVNDCQKYGLSLFGAKYLLNKESDKYTTIRLLKYYYGYDTKLRKVITSTGSNGYNNGAGDYGCGKFDMKATNLSRDEFIAKVSGISCSKPGCEALKAAAGDIYDLAKQNSFNPELVYSRAMVEGYSPGGSSNNFYGIGCTNSGGGTDCKKYSSVTQGALAFIQLMNGYNVSTLFDVYNIKHYAYIGSSWIPGSSGKGGCYYFPYIAKYYTDTARRDYVKTICDSGTGSEVATNAQDQEAYSFFQIEKMNSARKTIFGISPENCTQNGPGGAGGFKSQCTTWRQGDPAWGGITLGSSGKSMSAIGCTTTSVAMAIACSGTGVTIPNFNPGTFANYLSSNGGYSGSMFVWNSVSKVAPSFRYQGKIYNLSTTLPGYLNKNYALIVKTSDRSITSSTHWMYVTGYDGKSNISVKNPANGLNENYNISLFNEAAVYSY